MKYEAHWVKEKKRTIGWLAGHEIHLEIEGVLDLKKKVAFKHYSRLASSACFARSQGFIECYTN